MSARQSAQILYLQPRPSPRPAQSVVDYDAWYHAEEVRKDQQGRA